MSLFDAVALVCGTAVGAHPNPNPNPNPSANSNPNANPNPNPNPNPNQVGGGFLAIPEVTAPLGVLPSAVG